MSCKPCKQIYVHVEGSKHQLCFILTSMNIYTIFLYIYKSKAFLVFQCHSIPSHRAYTIILLQRAGNSRSYIYICIIKKRSVQNIQSLFASGQDWVPIRRPARQPTTTFDSQEDTAPDAGDPGSVPGPGTETKDTEVSKPVDDPGSVAIDPNREDMGREPVRYIYIYIYPPILLYDSIYLSMLLSSYIYVSIYIYLSIRIYIATYLSIYISIYIYQSFFLSNYLSHIRSLFASTCGE